MSITLDLLNAALPGGIPARIQSLIQPQLADTLIEDFKVGPIFGFCGAQRPVRVAVSDQDEPERWASTVRKQWPGQPMEQILALSGPGVRRMIDTDGSSRAEVYLDDLQDHAALAAAEALREPGDEGALMCLTTTLPSGTRSLVTRHAQPPFMHLLGPLAESVADLVDQGAAGLWGLRWRMGLVVSVIWVSEARWTGTAELANQIATDLGPPPQWLVCQQLLSGHGLTGYPDAIELHIDETADVTMGVLKS
jgi:hypothetical protein